MKMILTTLILLLPLTSYASDQVINLDGVKLCVPEKYAPPSTPFTIGPNKETDETTDTVYNELFVQFEPDELKKAIPSYKPDTYLIQGKRRYTPKGVTISHVNSIEDLSLVQQRVIELIKTGKEKTTYWRKLKLYKIEHDPVIKDFSLLNSKKLPKSINKVSLHKWIAAHCQARSKEKRYECNIQRIVGNLAYDVTIPNHNMKNRIKIEKFIESKLARWQKKCKNK